MVWRVCDMRRVALGLILFVGFVVGFGAHASTDGAVANRQPSIRISIGATAKQTFMGFGASQPRDQARLFNLYGAEKVGELARKVYGELGMNWVRVWVASGPDQSLSEMKARFYRGYLDNGYLDTIGAAGARKLLLAPARGEAAPADSMQSYAAKLAQFIFDLDRERGVRIDVTGVANEPAGFSASQLGEAAKYLREELDARGMREVGIVSPECASPDACATRAVTLMKGDRQLWQGLRGVATHSYNMGANAAVENLILDTGKEYWITEAGRALPRNVDEEPGDVAEAAGVAARFLNDMNHSVTHWFWFIGIGHFDKHPNKDSGQVLARPDDQFGAVKFNTKYYYLKQLREAFDLGAIFYPSSSLEEGRMNWGYGQKPAVIASMARNPDGTWGVGVVNITGLPDSKIAQFLRGESYEVELTIPVDAQGRGYQVYRSLPRGIFKWKVLDIPAGSSIKLLVHPQELITLRSK